MNNEYQMISRDAVITDGDRFRHILNLHPHDSIIYTWDEVGFADLAAELYGDEIRYCFQDDTWYCWNGTIWEKQDNKCIAKSHIEDMSGLLLLYCDEMEATTPNLSLKPYREVVRKLRKNGTLGGIAELLQEKVRISATELDAHPYILNTPAGAFDLKTRELITDRRDLYLTQVTGTDLLQGDACARWYSFIDEVCTGDKQKAAFLQRALGYSLLGVGREECMFLIYGQDTRNGKSTLMSAIGTALGQGYYEGASADLITESGKTDFNSPQPALRKLVNSRVVIMNESELGEKLASSNVKALTGRDTLTTRGLYEGSFDFVPQFTMWLTTNHLPTVTDDSIFKSDRMWVIPFSAHFDKVDRSVDLKSLLNSPACQPTVLQWLVDGCTDYLLNGLNPPDSVLNATQEYREQNDKIGVFIRTCTTYDPTGKTYTDRRDFYQRYSEWCQDEGYRCCSPQALYKALQDHGMLLVTIHGNRVFKSYSIGSGTIKLV